MPSQFDWQVTICFYTAVHLINCHLANFGLQYRKHKDVKDALNPYTISPAKLPEDEYSAYISLQSLSRRSRYLVNEKDQNITSPNAFFTYEKHFSKALIHLDKLMQYFDKKYSMSLQKRKVNCSQLNYNHLNFFTR